MIRNRPELAPHFLLNIDSQYELGPGDEIRGSHLAEERETLAIMTNINFQNLQAQTPTPGGLELPGRGSYVSESSGTDGGPTLCFKFDHEELIYSEKEQDKLRNFKPQAMNKNVSEIGFMIDKSNWFWGSKNSFPERTVASIPVVNMIRKNRLICTKGEYDACTTIARSFKCFKLRKEIHNRIMKRRIIVFHKKQLKKFMQRGNSSSRKATTPRSKLRAESKDPSNLLTERSN
jgi:hypothetical protein